MIKKTIEYTDYEGNERKETFYFNLTKTELLELEVSEAGGFTKMIERIQEARDAKTVLEVLKEIVHKSYGVKSPDGKKFVKSDELSTGFEQTEAYDQLMMDMIENPEKASAFFNGLLPKDLEQQVDKYIKEHKDENK